MIQAIVFGQVSFPMIAFHVIVISLALLGACLGHAFQEITDCPAPRSNPLLPYATPELCVGVVSGVFGLLGVFGVGAGLESWRSARSKHSKVAPPGASATAGAMASGEFALSD